MSITKNTISDLDILQSEKDIEYVREKLERLDADIPVPERLSAQYLLRRAENKKRLVWLRPVLIAGAVALAIVIGLTASGISLFIAGTGMGKDAVMFPNNFDSQSGLYTASPELAEKPDDKYNINGSLGASPDSEEKESSEKSYQESGSGAYTAGSYSEVRSVIEGSLFDFAHVVGPNKRADSDSAALDSNEKADAEGTGVIGRITVSIENTIVMSGDAEYHIAYEAAQTQPHDNVVTSGTRRVYSVYSDELGPLVCIDDITSGTLAAAIKLGRVITVKQLMLYNDDLIVISDTDENFGEISVGAFGVMVADTFDLSDSYAPRQTERYACEGKLFTVIANSGGIFAAVRRFAVDGVDPDSMEIHDMSYIPMVMYNGQYSRISPSDIYISPEMASMDYLIVFRLDVEDGRALAYLGSADPLPAVNYLVEKLK